MPKDTYDLPTVSVRKPGEGDFSARNVVRRVPRPTHRLEHPVGDPKKRDWKKLCCHAYVVGCNRRPGLILPYLADQSHTLHIGTDYDLPPGSAPMRADYDSGSPLLGNYRVFRAHQDICERMLNTWDDFALIFEDDAVPNDPDWVEVVNKAATHLDVEDGILSLYGRNFQRGRFERVNAIGTREILKLRADVSQSKLNRGGLHHVHGSLAYLITRRGAEKIKSLKWSGIPCDVDFWDEAPSFRFLHPSPFNHDRSTGSILFPSSCPATADLPPVPTFDAPRNSELES